MENNDKVRFIGLMNGLADIYGVNLTKPGIEMRFNALRGYSIERVEQAANIIVRTRKYTTMPVPARS